MLIRIATIDDIPSWLQLACEVSPIFGVDDMSKTDSFNTYIQNKISTSEAVVAVDYMSGDLIGAIGFSKNNNRISWLGVSEIYRGQGAGSRLLSSTLNQLDTGSDIIVTTFSKSDSNGAPARQLYEKFGFIEKDKDILIEGQIRSKYVLPANHNKKGGSFHYNYARYKKWSEQENCPVCQSMKASHEPTLIKELHYSWVECYMKAQGRLFGKCHVLSKVHSEHFYDMPKEDMANFMGDVQKVAKALHNVTGAIKINYEIHGNSMPHLHAHLFPRYLDDDFPSKPIDYNLYEPCPYKNEDEYNWFVENIRKSLA